MRSPLVIVGATVAGIALAWLAFAPAPEALPEAPKMQPTEAPAAVAEAPPVDKTHNPVNAAFHQRINQPDAALAGIQGSLWTVIKRELSQQDKPEADALIKDATDLVRDLREARLRPDEADFKDLNARQDALRVRLAGTSLATPVIDQQFERMDHLAQAYANGQPLAMTGGPSPGAGSASSGSASSSGASSSTTPPPPRQDPPIQDDWGDDADWEPVPVTEDNPLGLPLADPDDPFGSWE